MAQAKVFHARLTEGGRVYDPRTDGPWPLDDEHYTLVAEVEIPDDATEAEACEFAFDRTNTVHQAWWHNEEVRAAEHDAYGIAPRSTSVGDIVVLVGGGSFRVEGTGWTEVPR
jgi:hypothetical protein